MSARTVGYALVTVAPHYVGMNLNHQLATTAAGGHGVFSVAEARRLGIPGRTIRSRLDAGVYVRVYPGVYAIAGTADSPRRRMSAAAKSFPLLTAVSHQTAAELWGLTRRGMRTIEVTTTRWDRVRRDDIRVHESLDLLPADVVDLDGIPVTTAVRTVVDLGASNKWMVESALEQGIRLGLFDLAQLQAFVARVGRRGRRGVGVVRPLIERRLRWDNATESALEDEFRKLLSDQSLPQPEVQYEVRDRSGSFVCRADFAYPALRLLIELDSEAHHLDRLTFRRDRSKQNRAVVLGWTVLRYTWWDLREEPFRVVAEVKSAVGG